MRNRNDTETSPEQDQLAVHDRDRWPNLTDVLQRVLAAEDIPKTDVQRIEIACQANGEATARVWARREDEPEGVYLEPS